MSSIAKTNISLSKKDLSKSRIPPLASRNVVFYHKATVGQFTINLLSLTMPSTEMPTAVQATLAEISGAQLTVNKKNLNLVSSSKGNLIQNLDYTVIDSSTISLIGPYEGVGTEVDEIFVGTINSAPISDLVVASAKSVDKSYELAVGSTILNLGREYEVGVNPNEDVGIIKVFVNGVLALRDVDYVEVDAGSGYGTTIQFMVAPVSIPHQVVVDFGVMSITDNNAIGTIESLGGAIKKIADDLSVVAGTSASDYYSASPSEVERRAFGDTILSLDSKYDTTQNLSEYTKTKWQIKSLGASVTVAGAIPSLAFNNLVAGVTYRVTVLGYVQSVSGEDPSFRINDPSGTAVLLGGHDQSVTGTIVDYCSLISPPFVSSTSGSLSFVKNNATGTIFIGMTVVLEELPNHEATTQWT